MRPTLSGTHTLDVTWTCSPPGSTSLPSLFRFRSPWRGSSSRPVPNWRFSRRVNRSVVLKSHGRKKLNEGFRKRGDECQTGATNVTETINEKITLVERACWWSVWLPYCYHHSPVATLNISDWSRRRLWVPHRTTSQGRSCCRRMMMISSLAFCSSPSTTHLA